MLFDAVGKLIQDACKENLFAKREAEKAEVIVWNRTYSLLLKMQIEAIWKLKSVQNCRRIFDSLRAVFERSDGWNVRSGARGMHWLDLSLRQVGRIHGPENSILIT
jgi:hypothetical protein